MSGCFRQRVIAFFLERKLLNERLAKNMVEWTPGGFSVDASIRIPWAGSRAQPCESPLTCSRCHKPMKVIAVITDSAQVLKILRHLIKKGTPPPGLDLVSLN
jgi:hypothetical protein